MQYRKVVEGIFAKKLNRFVAEVYIAGELEKVHIKNTGRLTEILQPGAVLALETSDNPNRKTRYSIIAARKGARWINIDSQISNQLVYDALVAGNIQEFHGIRDLKREATFGNSRFDLFYYRGARGGFIEVKGVTLERDGLAMFPDAPTIRGRKHVETLIEAMQAGYEATVLFVIQMKGCHSFTPHYAMDPAFHEALQEAEHLGVRILAYECYVTESTIQLDRPIPMI
ncbi:DNA/RNA nuclease SfsA [Oceanobacillus alkalisoli]|uniref:DNA/RNA nuclease SfsA n=1 Tax=Oceanobacillus alkalisoli TaxID=2925113 RepID=UPI001EE4792E|nr:DNA/RNA nuclease SfsA [Oceanobacillus alkalisoli]MCG5104678.1 DNA/RNA nuclease SfsA [Oceanobacillus alkalisoli]